jgi:hypothetical protein
VGVVVRALLELLMPPHSLMLMLVCTTQAVAAAAVQQHQVFRVLPLMAVLAALAS